MTKYKFHLFLFFCFALSLIACNKEDKNVTIEKPSPVPTITKAVTQTQLSVQSTNTPVPPFFFPAPTSIDDSSRPTISAPLPQNSTAALPGNLNIEVYEILLRDFFNYEEMVWEKHYGEVGGRYNWQYFQNGKQFLSGKQFSANEKDTRIYVTLDNESVFEAECLPSPIPRMILTSWVYEDHWAIQTFCKDNFDIFQDGTSLNISKNYDSSFGLQLIGNKPFYLFRKNDLTGLYYDGKEVTLEFDKIILAYCCTIDIHPPMHYENMITFAATKGEKLYYVAIGLFERK